MIAKLIGILFPEKKQTAETAETDLCLCLRLCFLKNEDSDV